MATCLETSWRIDPAEARVVVIPNTLELTTLWVSQPLRDEVESNPRLSFGSGFEPWPFNPAGDLDLEGLFPESVRARRGRVRHGA